ncbi:EthD family reductase [Spiractinospora alimapuensis]|uniref:EthD family reductase n=1 Tax=Spiractinospora alimapuensis TaxID=2820884 RepID=UPI001F1AE601|nr:EthD family reductase [Spiractinospora alimapuensis]QVQ53327.1 EthD family reductase [Spiractinospora alimapuensis]
MLKVISLMRRAETMSSTEFRTWVLETHVPYARALPGLRGYRVNVPVDPDASAYDAVNEMYFDDEEARAAAFASDAGKAAGADAAAHTAERVHVISTEHRPLDGG